MYADPNRAAQYVRMSTDMQTYSIENQSAAIAGFAVARGLDIIRTYVDSGKSGLSIDRRMALQDLLGDVRSGRADFSHLLIYDVSRWGRFQDPDESAYYEFICRQAGIVVHYCAEEFENNGTLIASIVKNIKRAMAAEYSRELSVKVFAGQSRLVSKGFALTSVPGFGLRRLLVDENGNPKCLLAKGQHKNIHTDRVVLVPGPPNEIQTVNRVYDLFINKSESLKAISRLLNAEGLLNSSGRPWGGNAVRELLTNEKYIGNAVYNRTSNKLSLGKVRNPPHKWVRAVGAFQPIVPLHDFRRAQALLFQLAKPYRNNELLDWLCAIWCAKGSLRTEFLETVPGAPSAQTYMARFGGLLNAYEMIGYKRPFMARKVPNRKLRRLVALQVIEGIQCAGGTVEPIRGLFQLRVNGDFSVSIIATRSRMSRKRKSLGVSYLSVNRPDILIIVRTTGRDLVADYFVLPTLFFPRSRWLSVSGKGYDDLRDFHMSSLDPFYELCARTRGAIAS